MIEQYTYDSFQCLNMPCKDIANSNFAINYAHQFLPVQYGFDKRIWICVLISSEKSKLKGSANIHAGEKNNENNLRSVLQVYLIP